MTHLSLKQFLRAELSSRTVSSAAEAAAELAYTRHVTFSWQRPRARTRNAKAAFGNGHKGGDGGASPSPLFPPASRHLRCQVFKPRAVLALLLGWFERCCAALLFTLRLSPQNKDQYYALQLPGFPF